MQDSRVFWAFLHGNDKIRILTFLNNQYRIAPTTRKGFMIMRLSTAKQFNQHKCLERSKGQLSSPPYNALQWTDIIELRLEGP